MARERGRREAAHDRRAHSAAARLDFQLVPFTLLQGGYLGWIPGRDRACAGIREADHPLVQRFTKAHELGHHVMDDILELPPSYKLRDRHWAHERFAAALLMPRAWVVSFIDEQGARGGDIVGDVAARFCVSRPAAEVRLRELGHLDRIARGTGALARLDRIYARCYALAHASAFARRRIWELFRSYEVAVDKALA